MKSNFNKRNFNQKQSQFDEQKFDQFLLGFKQDFGDEFCKAYKESFNAENIKGFRVNTQKISASNFQNIYKSDLEKIPFFDNAFYLENDKKIGNTLLHIIGAIYVQEPSSMIPVASVKNLNFENKLVLDMCASPGGKTTQIASLMNNTGFLVSNEIDTSRAKILLSNVERLGLKNVAVTNCSPQELARRINAKFDYIFVDAPCSGEGMFRKDKNAINEWNENLKFYNKKRQLDILWCANSLLKNGGYLIYSTCTYNTIENESVINDFCNEFGYKIFSPCQDVMDNTFGGITLNGNADLSKTRHFFPFLSKGEGQYVACLQKLGKDLQEKQPLLNSNLTQMEQKLVEDFFNKNLTNFDLKNFVFYKIGNYINVMPAKTVDFGNIKYLCYGVAIAEIVKDRLIPTQQFFSSYGKNFKSQLNLSTDGSLYKNYLLGEQISFNQVENDKNATLCYDNNSNYASVLVDGMSIGGVKIVDGVLKNHYPKALRTNKVE